MDAEKKPTTTQPQPKQPQKPVVKSTVKSSPTPATKTDNGLEAIYEGIVSGKQEIIDITHDYSWSRNTITNTLQTWNEYVPSAFVIERRQTVSSNIANLINAFRVLHNTANNLRNEEVSKKLSEIGNKIGGLCNISSKSPSNNTNEQQPSNQTNTSGNANTSGNTNGSSTTSTSTQTATPSSGSKPSEGNSGAANGQETEMERATSGPQAGTGDLGKVVTGSSGSDGGWNFSPIKWVGNGLSNVGNGLSNLGSDICDWFKEQWNGFSSFGDVLMDTNHFTGILSPYQWLYFTKITGKQYVFPYLGDDTSSFKVNNAFGEAQAGDTSGFLSGNRLTNAIESYSMGISATVNDLLNVIDLFSDNRGTLLRTNFSEKAKYYNVPESKEIKITFPLYNTIIKNSWKKNYKFIFDFTLRNMMFKVDSMTYKQPLLYDVTIPGVMRFPLAYVSSIQVIPQGVIRPLSYGGRVIDLPNFKSSDNQRVHVPEAWLVTIGFKSLLVDSANLFLSNIQDNIKVSAILGTQNLYSNNIANSNNQPTNLETLGIDIQDGSTDNSNDGNQEPPF